MTGQFHKPETVDITLADGLFVKSTHIPTAGTMLPQHAHQTSHVSFVSNGAVRCWKDGELLGDFHAPVGINIEAMAKHRFLTLMDATTILCIHRLNADGDIEIHETHEFTDDELEGWQACRLD